MKTTEINLDQLEDSQIDPCAYIPLLQPASIEPALKLAASHGDIDVEPIVTFPIGTDCQATHRTTSNIIGKSHKGKGKEVVSSPSNDRSNYSESYCNYQYNNNKINYPGMLIFPIKLNRY